MKFTYLGHSTFVIEFGGKTLLIDPFITGNPIATIAPEEIKADYILLTHGHADHSADVESIGKRTGATVIGCWEVSEYYAAKGLKTHPMNIGGKKKFDFGTVKMVNAVHSSSWPNGNYAGAVGGFVVWDEEYCFYFAGDTALTLDMQLLPMTCPPIDIAILPIGDNVTMGYEDAVIAADFIHCDKIIGCHYDTFPYVEIDHAAAIEAFHAENKELVLLEVGKSVEIE